MLWGLVKKMNIIYLFSIITRIIVDSFRIIISITKGSFHDYFQLVFIGAIVTSLGLLNKNKREIPFILITFLEG